MFVYAFSFLKNLFFCKYGDQGVCLKWENMLFYIVVLIIFSYDIGLEQSRTKTPRNGTYGRYSISMLKSWVFLYDFVNKAACFLHVIVSKPYISTSKVYTSGKFKWSLVSLAGLLVVYGINLILLRQTLLTWLAG